ncbi:MAG: hypothetical protein D6722_10255 [Bacteroidetes bacterium]|nr:MAG: hypothetical protein D6722_10255 [Bacteroidota bacterium]
MTTRVFSLFSAGLLVCLLVATGCKREHLPADYRDAWLGDYRLLRTCEEIDDGNLLATVNDSITAVVQKSDALGIVFFLGETFRVAEDGSFEADPPPPGNGEFYGSFTNDGDVTVYHRSSGVDTYQLCTYIGRRQD